MPDRLFRYYWDSNVFLSYIDGDPARLSDIDALLLDAQRGEIEVVTSVVTIAEVAYAAQEKAARVLDEHVEQQINALWTPPSPVVLAEFHQLVAEQARDLMRHAMENGWKLLPYDALHLSTALRLGVDEFHTYDTGLSKYAPTVGYKIRPPTASQPMLPPGG